MTFRCTRSPLLAQFGFDLASSVLRESLGFGIAPRAVLSFLRPVFLVDALLAPVGLTAAFVIADEPLALLGILPLAVLLWVFARDRRQRIDQALALSHAYHGASDQARRDGLTGVFNRLGWDEALTAAQASILDTRPAGFGDRGRRGRAEGRKRPARTRVRRCRDQIAGARALTHRPGAGRGRPHRRR